MMETTKSKSTILIVDDDQTVLNLLRNFLLERGLQVISLTTGNRIQQILAKESIDLIILDIMLGSESGIELCKEIRRTHIIPIIMLSGIDDLSERMVALEIGADDYVIKPFHPRELLSRVKALLRRVAFYSSIAQDSLPVESQTNNYFFNGWQLNLISRQILDPSKVEVYFTSSEYQILLAFLNAPNRILSRDVLINQIYQDQVGAFERSIDIHISRLRQKIEKDTKNPQLIKTVRNGGYVFSCKVATV